MKRGQKRRTGGSSESGSRASYLVLGLVSGERGEPVFGAARLLVGRSTSVRGRGGRRGGVYWL